MSQEAHNIDQLISEDQAQQRGITLKPLEEKRPQEKIEVQHDEVKENPVSYEEPSHEAPPSEQPDQVEQPKNQESSDPRDEYGNPIAKGRVYTEEEVQRMMRDRIERERQRLDTRQPTQTQSPPNETREEWEQQLESFIDNKLEKRQREEQERSWRDQEYNRQMEFQEKFTRGVGRYNDFQDVVTTKKITDTMMMATRNLKDPAAFLYSAAKSYPQELERIASITDPYAQAAEIGRLDEKMVKSHTKITKAPHVLSTTTSDMPAPAVKPKKSIEDRIVEHAANKRR